MYETLVTPRPANPTLVYKGPDTLPPPQWRVLKSRMKRVEERFGDLQRHPWVGERQAGKAINLYNTNSRQVDRDLRAVPYGERLRTPASGAFPLVQGMEVGTGPDPWHGTPWLQQPASGARGGQVREHRGDLRHDRGPGPDGDGSPPPFIQRNTGAEVDPGRYEDGPASRPPPPHSDRAPGPSVSASDMVKAAGGGQLVKAAGGGQLTKAATGAQGQMAKARAQRNGAAPPQSNALTIRPKGGVQKASNGQVMRKATWREKIGYKIDSNLPNLVIKGTSHLVKGLGSATGHPLGKFAGEAAGSLIEKAGSRFNAYLMKKNYGHLRV